MDRSDPDAIWVALSEHIPLSALDDPSPHARCLNGTRNRLISDIMGHLDGKLGHIIWLYGPTGTGKTAVALSIAERLRTADRLAGCYFFPRTDPKRQSLLYILPTIAYQLGILYYAPRGVIAKALVQDPGLLGKDRFYSHQVNPLFVNPLDGLAYLLDNKGNKPVIILDGVEKCCSPKEYSTVIHFFKLLVDGLGRGPGRNFHLILTSSTNASCEEVLGSLEKTPRVVNIQSYDAGPDITRLLRVRLTEIALRRSVQSSIPWPSEGDIKAVRDRASGNFGYISKMTRFVDDLSPIQQLASVLKQIALDSESSESRNEK
ncbi:hypothetical protein CONPUDRAFT_140452 [Coniophora puteana RWD-64-598 SS2]|uniref:Nephrocystin 3-like N-terminal domain-containing protein n=1 Tax=Coniophora puteana (strain RWD-64-598) TaxID=741705 RepID=R7SEW3_CONPW|nr:uncharacterized protein CONPUDRAFT_140452 [Coniophora puteana RWD-64-598 SS2]EIW74706.1 hypothetical protein CONPUDRAFT_140452 [Coniophora puteana RWD-64-598 SS2]